MKSHKRKRTVQDEEKTKVQKRKRQNIIPKPNRSEVEEALAVISDQMQGEYLHVGTARFGRFRSRMVADIIFGRHGKRYYHFNKVNVFRIMGMLCFCMPLNITVKRFYPFVAYIAGGIALCAFVNFAFLMYIDIISSLSRNFQVAYLVGTALIFSICDTIIEHKQGNTRIAINIFSHTLFQVFITICIFIDAIPFEIFPVTFRRILWGFQCIQWTICSLTFSLFSKQYEIQVMQQVWLLSDIRASCCWTLTLFMAKIFYTTMFCPSCLVLCSVRMEYKSGRTSDQSNKDQERGQIIE